MNGVMIPGVSAGSNHVGAMVTWTPQVSWPSGAASVGPATPTSVRNTRVATRTWRMGPSSMDQASRLELFREVAAPLSPSGAACHDALRTTAERDDRPRPHRLCGSAEDAHAVHH